MRYQKRVCLLLLSLFLLLNRVFSIECPVGHIKGRVEEEQYLCLPCNRWEYSSSDQSNCVKECPPDEERISKPSGFFQGCTKSKMMYSTFSNVRLESCPNSKLSPNICRECEHPQLLNVKSNSCVDACDEDQVTAYDNSVCIDPSHCTGYIYNNKSCELCAQQAPEFYPNYEQYEECGSYNIHGLICGSGVDNDKSLTSKELVCECHAIMPFRGVDLVSCVSSCGSDEFVVSYFGYKQCYKYCNNWLVNPVLGKPCISVYECTFFVNIHTNSCSFACNGYLLTIPMNQFHYLNYLSLNHARRMMIDENAGYKEEQEVLNTVRVCLDVCFYDFIQKMQYFDFCVEKCAHGFHCLPHSYMHDDLSKIQCPENYGRDDETDYARQHLKQIFIFPQRVGCVYRCPPPLKTSSTGEFCVKKCSDIFELDASVEGFCESCRNYIYEWDDDDNEGEGGLKIIRCSRQKIRQRRNTQIWIEQQIQRYYDLKFTEGVLENEPLKRLMKEVVEEWAGMEELYIEDQTILRYIYWLFHRFNMKSYIFESKPGVRTVIGNSSLPKNILKLIPSIGSQDALVISRIRLDRQYFEESHLELQDQKSDIFYEYYVLDYRADTLCQLDGDCSQFKEICQVIQELETADSEDRFQCTQESTAPQRVQCRILQMH